MKNTFIKNCLALFLITLTAGILLAVVNEVTKEPIAEAENNSKYEAYEEIYPNVDFKEDGSLNELLSSKSIDKSKTSYLKDCTVNEALRAYNDENEPVGCVISVTSHSGYGGDITIAVGISDEKNEITGFKVLSHSETAGLGAKAADDEFQKQFAGKSSENYIGYVKNCSASNSEIDAISGATITTSAVTEAVNAAIEYYSIYNPSDTADTKEAS